MSERALVVESSPEIISSPSPDTKARVYLGRHVYGLAAIFFGLISLVWRDFGAPWQQIHVFGNVPHREVLVYLAAALELFGGFAIQWRRTARAGALVLGVVFFAFALLWVPHIIAQPRLYNWYGNFFEQLSIFSGALIVCAAFTRNSERAAMMSRMGYIFFGLCTISFTLEQAFYLRATASFVPKWIPPGQMFWAVATTIAFALAAIALLSGRMALLAAQLTTVMILGFQLLIWIPAPFADPHKLINWAGNAQNLAIAGAAWIVTDFLRQGQSSELARSKAA
jgi:uncharacterized membrane protein YphA (DoxX/SURF4 family)